ncbi:Brp/Blh family beta-carotene 15,15'-dioxygenase [Haloarchaeobius sp. TZWWS8]|uniref:Brp/Blh family beta-carotene 15,15'-dioxygenase n=1 Tax=Haloarchaeobius sp. TZWWS8 TaxID=3446121 RepID=UPI003EC03CB4
MTRPAQARGRKPELTGTSRVTDAKPALDGVRSVLRRRGFVPVWGVLLVLTLLTAAGYRLHTRLGYGLLLLSVFLFGLSHGAVDHLLVRRLLTPAGPATEAVDTGRRATGNTAGTRILGRRLGRRLSRFARAYPLATVGVVYLLLGGTYLGCWLVEPAAAFVLFVCLTAAHWGLGDLYSLVAVDRAGHLRTRGERLLVAAVRGAIPMLVPLLAHPDEFRRVATLVVEAVDPTASSGLAGLFTLSTRLTIGACFGLLLATTLVLGARRGANRDDSSRADSRRDDSSRADSRRDDSSRADSRRDDSSRADWLFDAGETLLLVGFFAVVPPVVAIGVYFPLWHSLRHVFRLELLDPPAVAGFERGRLVPGLVRFARDAAPLTAVALVFMGGLFLALPAARLTLSGTVAVYLVLLAVLTLPHAAIAAWADLAQGVWSR